MKKLAWSSGAPLAFLLAAAAPLPLDSDAARASIQAALDASAAAWTAGRLDAFMTVYENDPATTYVGGGKVVTGYGSIRAMYAARYGGSGTAGMGFLKVDILSFRPLGETHCFVVGRYHLFRSNTSRESVTGLTTLLFDRTQAGWRIIADHSG